MLISIVIPCHDEELNVSIVYDEVSTQINDSEFEIEFIFVDDGSTDSTWERISNLALEYPNVLGIQLSRNFGHALAKEAGLINTKGDLIIMMDADLQHPPSLIPELIQTWKSGFNIVNTIRDSTAGNTRIKTLSSGLFYKLINSLSEININSGEADFRLVDRQTLDIVLSMPESPKFFRGLFNWIGFNKTEVHYLAPIRVHGKSSFSALKMLELARVGLTSFSKAPLTSIFFIGIALSLFSFISLTAMIFVKLIIDQFFFSNLSIVVVFILLITGLILTSQGILATYVVDIHNAAKSRPNYITLRQTNSGK